DDLRILGDSVLGEKGVEFAGRRQVSVSGEYVVPPEVACARDVAAAVFAVFGETVVLDAFASIENDEVVGFFGDRGLEMCGGNAQVFGAFDGEIAFFWLLGCGGGSVLLFPAIEAALQDENILFPQILK